MSDQGKTGTRFEPPPWEREAFEALARRREEEAEAARIATEALAGTLAAPDVETIVPERIDEVAAEEPEAAEDVVPDAGVEEQAALDERHVQAMLMQLRHEEPRFGRSARKVGLVAVVFTAVIGMAMLIGGLLVAASAAGKATAMAGGAVICVFGLSFLGMSVWVWSSLSRVKGR